MRIKTEYWAKPARSTSIFDWTAIDDETYEPGQPIGYGSTEQEAIEDLRLALSGGAQ